MGALIAGIIGALATLIVGGISAWIGVQQYDQQQKTIQEQFEYTKERNAEVDQQNATSVQTRAKDLAAAGINPMLAGLSGAQVSQGNVYSAIPVVHQGFEGLGNIGNIISGIGQGVETERSNKANEELRKRELDLEEYRNITDMKRQQNEARKTGIEKKLAEQELSLKEREFAQEQLRQYNDLIERAKDRDLKSREVEASIKTDNDRLEYDYWKAREDRLFEIAKTASLLEQEDQKMELQKEWQQIEKELNERELKIKKGVAVSSEIRGYIAQAESIWRSIENIVFPWTSLGKQVDNKGNVTYSETTTRRGR